MKKLIPQSAAKKFLHLFGSPLCNSESLPKTDFNFCTPDIRASEIRRIFIALVSSAPFVDVSNGAEWVIRLSQAGTEPDAIRTLWVIGDKPAPTSKRAIISGGRKVTVRKDHVIRATIDDVNQTNHNFIMSLGLGKHFRVWYETMGGFMFGGNDGIVTLFNADMVLLRGQGEIMTYQATMDWNNLRTEDKCISPIFDDVAGTCDPITDLAVVDTGYYDLTFSWAMIPGADFYQYRVYSNDYDSGVITTHLTSITTVPVLTPDTEYTIEVRAICSTGAIGDWEVTTGSTDELPECTAVTDLGFDAMTPVSISFSWGDPMLTGTYKYQVIGSDGYDSGVIDTAATFITVGGLTPEVHYTVTVWNVCGGFDGPSSVIEIDTDAPPVPAPLYGSKMVAGYYGHKTTLDLAGDEIARVVDVSGNNNHLDFATGPARATYAPVVFGVQGSIRFPTTPYAIPTAPPAHGIYKTATDVSGAVTGALWPSSKAQVFVVLKAPFTPGTGTLCTYGNAFYSSIPGAFEILESSITGGGGGQYAYGRLHGNVTWFTTRLLHAPYVGICTLYDMDMSRPTDEIKMSDNTGATGTPVYIGNNTGPFVGYPLVLGARPDGSFPINGDVAAMLIYDGSLTGPEAAAVMADLVSFFSL